MSWQWSTWRLFAAGVLLAVLVIVVAVGTFSPHWRVCDGSAPTQVCRPLELWSPFVVLSVLLVLGIGFPDIKLVEAGPGGVKFERAPDLPPSADLERRVKLLEAGKFPEWLNETRQGGGETNGGTGTSPGT